MTTPPISSPPSRPYGSAAPLDTHACPPKGQLLDRQTHALDAAGHIRIFADKKSGKNAERKELWKTLDPLRGGDTLVVPSLDRLGHSIQDLIAIVSGLRKRGTGFTSPHEALDTTTPDRRLVFHVFPSPRRAHLRTRRPEHQRGPGRRPRPRRPTRPPASHDRRTGTPRPRPARPSGEHPHLDREAPPRSSSASPATPSTTTCPN
ncbi:recombinase family protein [Streptomyces sp. MRC013]|uniref:recombinase family protein n=1 Tax=Streptomyces sp. MRC013 TaxID=2898276 RepID=UPI00202722C9|nr:recombinase family protein [Streptomyces sp. MRC013]URM92537.1 recombinase family protein [Streptomyces sp. MRC013]